ncbi:MAG: HTTM domain-containing protein [Bacteroidota bacterium]
MRFLFRPVDISALVFFRVLFGILGFIDVFAFWTYKHLYKQSFDPANLQFRYYGFEWVLPFPEPLMSIFLLIIMAAAVGVALGWRYRLCTTVFAFGFAYTFLVEKAYYLNHGYLFTVLSFLMIALPAHRAWSADVLRRPELRLRQIPYWPLFLLQFLMGVVYFFGGIAKINADWLNAMPLKLWLKAKSNMWLIGPIWANEWAAYFMSYGGLLLDLFVVFFLIFRRTRPWAFAAVLFFHLVNSVVFKIGIFPWLSIGLTLLYFPSDTPRRIANWLVQRIPRLAGIGRWWERRLERAGTPPPLGIDYSPQQRQLITTAFIALMLINVALPLRHHYFAGDVTWTEEGHRYAWRMMLRSKQGYGNFLIRTPAEGDITKVRPRNYLKGKQERKMYTHPDMILQFAHFLRDEFEAQGYKDVEVYANIKVKLNGRKYWPYIDPTVDLAQVEWSFLEEAEWILPEGEEEED